MLRLTETQTTLLSAAASPAVGAETAGRRRRRSTWARPRRARRRVPVASSASPMMRSARPGGATIEELTALLGWLPHMTRAALSRLRVRGHAVTLRSREGRKAYHLEARV